MSENTDAVAPIVGQVENISNNAGNSEEEGPGADLNVNNNATLKSGKRTVAPKAAKKAATAPKKVAAKISSPAKKKTTKPAAASTAHPKYSEMVAAAIVALKARQGSSRQAIVKYIEANFKVGDTAALFVRKALKKGLETGVLVSTKGVGATGSFRLAKVERKQTKKAVKKPLTPKKPVTPKKKAASAKKKILVKKSPTAKKAVAKKSKSPAKKVKKLTSKKASVASKAATKKSPAKKLPAAAKKAMPKKKVAPKKK